VTLGNNNGTDGQTDRRTDRVQRNMRPPPREEGRIITRRALNRMHTSAKAKIAYNRLFFSRN